MKYRDLREFMEALERQGELVRVTPEVDPHLEITEICQRVVREEGPALLFERVEGSDFPLLINLFGSRRRIEIALGRPPRTNPRLTRPVQNWSDCRSGSPGARPSWRRAGRAAPRRT